MVPGPNRMADEPEGAADRTAPDPPASAAAGAGRAPDDRPVCLCFGVSERKIVHHLKREKPPRASQLADCLGAGTGCGWCVPSLQLLHRRIVLEGAGSAVLPGDPDRYAAARRKRNAGRRG